MDAQFAIEFLNQLSSMASFGNELVSVSDAFATESSKASRKETTVNLSVKENRDYNYIVDTSPKDIFSLTLVLVISWLQFSY